MNKEQAKERKKHASRFSIQPNRLPGSSPAVAAHNPKSAAKKALSRTQGGPEEKKAVPITVLSISTSNPAAAGPVATGPFTPAASMTKSLADRRSSEELHIGGMIKSFSTVVPVSVCFLRI